MIATCFVLEPTRQLAQGGKVRWQVDGALCATPPHPANGRAVEVDTEAGDQSLNP